MKWFSTCGRGLKRLVFVARRVGSAPTGTTRGKDIDMGVWDITTPDGSKDVRDGDDRIREAKRALQEALAAHGVFPGDNPSTAPIYIPRGQTGTTAAKPVASKGGFYFDTDVGGMQWSDGSTWRSLGFPTGTVMIFFQAAAPSGWTKSASHNDKYLRVVSGSGGGSGGSSGCAGGHSHTVNAHTHQWLNGNGSGYCATYQSDGASSQTFSGMGNEVVGGSDVYHLRVKDMGTSGYVSNTSPGTSSYVPYYIDVIACTKD
ncbi:hypothetical protein ACFL3Q_12380 [Planctomycetota bacterium]